jgi:hypothetical protein
MITKIGITAGEIWEYLDHNNSSAEIELLFREIKKERDLILMSIGWLAREGHIVLEGSAPNYIVKLA